MNITAFRYLGQTIWLVSLVIKIPCSLILLSVVTGEWQKGHDEAGISDRQVKAAPPVHDSLKVIYPRYKSVPQSADLNRETTV